MNRKLLTMTIVSLIGVLLAACGPQAEPVKEEQASTTEVVVQIEPTNTSVPPTDTPVPPTMTPEPQPEISVEDLYGEWGQILFSMELHSDGTYALIWPYETGFEQPIEFGTFQLETNVVTFHPERYESTESPTIDGCHEGETYTYTASFSDGDTRFLKLIEEGIDPCGWRARHWNAEPVWQLMEKYSVE